MCTSDSPALLAFHFMLNPTSLVFIMWRGGRADKEIIWRICEVLVHFIYFPNSSQKQPLEKRAIFIWPYTGSNVSNAKPLAFCPSLLASVSKGGRYTRCSKACLLPQGVLQARKPTQSHSSAFFAWVFLRGSWQDGEAKNKDKGVNKVEDQCGRRDWNFFERRD